MDDYSDKKFEVRKKLLLIFISILAFLIFAYLSGDIPGITQILPFIELISAIIAIVIGLLSIVRFYTKRNRLNFLVLGIGFLFVGLLEGVQLISSIAGFADLFSFSTTEIFPLSMVLSKTFLAVIFFLSYMVYRDYDNPDSKREKGIALVVVLIFSIVVSSFLLFGDALSGYPEYAPALVGGILSLVMFTFSIFGYFRSLSWKYESFEYWQVFSLVFLLLSTIFFLPFLNLEYDLTILFSVLAKFFSYIFLFLGFLLSIYEMYEREASYLKELKEKNEQLLKSKNSVEEAYLLLRNEKWRIVKGKGKGNVKGILEDIVGGDNED
jgi:uncharacterized membrane protein YhdT